MRDFYSQLFFLFLIIAAPSGVTAQTESTWTQAATGFHLPHSEPLIRATDAGYFTLDYTGFYESLKNHEQVSVALPMPSGEVLVFHAGRNALIPEALQSKFPDVIAFDIVSDASRSVWGKMEISPKGVHAMIFRPGRSSVFIDPVFDGDPDRYICYERRNFLTDKVMDCHVEGLAGKPSPSSPKSGSDYNDCQLRTYRLALAATGEYTQFHGGQASDAFDAMVVTMNRVNGVYERDFSVSMVMVPNNDLLIYTNPGSDPYSNGSPGQMINENQQNITQVIGSANYDIGHVFGTNSGGLAGLGVTCMDNSKARGVTGSAAPIGDPFDIDYVAHEMGHEFGGNHSFNNSCGGNRNNATAIEPGSGSTIMAYAGICSPNIQQNSDDYFHGINMEEIGIQITQNTCQVNSPLENTSPEIGDIPSTVYLPVSTPFALTAPASDVDGDSLTWCWEQRDAEISSQPPVPTATGGPNFRSFNPVTDSTRYFPRLPIIANQGPYTWERLPSVARNMSFRVTVRDNAPNGGCTQYADVEVETIAQSGPFIVNYPSDAGIEWQGLDYEIVAWDVANTDASPVNAQLVDIFLSTDGGDTYPIQLANDVANIGTFSVQVPNIPTTNARIMVMNSGGTFFDISDNDFTITSIENGFVFLSDSLDYQVCQDDQIDVHFTISAVGDFDGTLSLTLSDIPLNGSADLSALEAQAGDTVTATLYGLQNTPAAVYNFTIEGTNGDGFTNDITYTVTVIATDPEASQPLQPENLAENVPVFTPLTWSEAVGPFETYHLQVATDVAFANLVVDADQLELNSYSLTGLLSGTDYYWRVANETPCGASDYSETFAFTTFDCNAFAATDVPVAIPPNEPASITSTITVDGSGILADVNVSGLHGTHSNVSDLVFKLTSPAGTEVTLATALCGASLTIAPNGNVVVNGSDPVQSYASSGAAGFGPDIPAGGVSGVGVLAQDGTSAPAELCDEAVNAGQLDGNIALIFRGNCTFVEKVLNAQEAGAVAAIIINNVAGDGYFDMGGTSSQITIPSVMVSLEDGNELVDQAGTGGQNFDFGLDDQATYIVFPCPPTDGNFYQPTDALSIFNGENVQGEWTLTITDNSDTDGGSLAGWTLNYCLSGEDVAIEEYKNLPVSIYPNPTRNHLTLIWGEDLGVEHISVYDMTGREIYRKSVNAQTRYLLDMRSYSPGMYFVKLKGDKTQVYKIVKQ